MFDSNELQLISAITQRADIKGADSIRVANLLVKIQREIEKIQAEADKLDKAIDEEKRDKKA